LTKSNSSIDLCTLEEDYDNRSLSKLFKPYLLEHHYLEISQKQSPNKKIIKSFSECPL
jgi:hypothetical protein